MTTKKQSGLLINYNPLLLSSRISNVAHCFGNFGSFFNKPLFCGALIVSQLSVNKSRNNRAAGSYGIAGFDINASIFR